MTEKQLKPGDRVRVTFEGTVGVTVAGRSATVTMPDGDGKEYFCQIPPGATVEVLRPPTLAERMAALAAELEDGDGQGYGGYTAKRIREELAAHKAVDQ